MTPYSAVQGDDLLIGGADDNLSGQAGTKIFWKVMPVMTLDGGAGADEYDRRRGRLIHLSLMIFR